MSEISRNVIFSEKQNPAGTLHNITQGLGWGGHYGNRLPQELIHELIILPQPITVIALTAPRINKVTKQNQW